MRIRYNKKLWIALIVFPILVVVLIVHARNPARSTSRSLSFLPNVIVWAWDRPEKLDFIDSNRVGVAFLSKTIQLRGDKVVVRPRMQPLDVPSQTKLVAVVRIETDQQNKPSLTQTQLTETVSALTATVRDRVTALQIDFDATASERDFYRRLLFAVRQSLPDKTPLSITALASWCKGDRWLDDLPIDEAVPMMFRLGVNRAQFQSRFVAGDSFPAEKCRNSAGAATDEPFRPPTNIERLYIFNPESWTKSSLDKYLEAYQ